MALPALLILSAAAPLLGESPGDAQGPLVLYEFAESSGAVVHDTSGVEPPLDLKIDSVERTTWRDGALIIRSGVVIASEQPAERLALAIRQSLELTIEAWIRPHSVEQRGPARMVSLSADPNQRDFTLGQDGGKFDVRLRTTDSNANGLPSTATSEDVVRSELMHVVYTRELNGEARLFVNGAQRGERSATGDFSTWNLGYSLVLGNERTGDRPWLGELHRVAIFARALSPIEITRRHQEGAGGRSVEQLAALLPPAAARKIDFVSDVQPILRERCFECHATGNEEGGLHLGVRARVLEGGAGGAVLIPGDAVRSRLLHFVAGIDKERRMPPEGQPLSAEQVGIMRAWIEQGAPWPLDADIADPRTERARSHWAFQPLTTPPPPMVRDAEWVRTTPDRFVLARLEAANLAHSPSASPHVLARRLHFDVAGLPPAPEEIAAFEEASRQDGEAAWSALVDRLLASHHYGERWGRHWLDVARYADSDGQEGDRDRPTAYHYRDFVIRALNDDLPFDTFVRWQIAGDEYEPQSVAAVAATGFLIAGPHTELENTFLEEERLRNRYNELDDLLSTLGSGILGLTIGCARCHDHKYDALSSREYYRMLAAFHSGGRAAPGVDGLELLAFRDSGSQSAPTWLFGRGDFYDREREVRLGFLDVLSRGRTAEDYWSAVREAAPEAASTLQRRALAEWLTDVEHGAGALVARVIVNRVWQHHFGAGLARTPSDLGVRGEAPTHPELLEWLADDFVRHGWRLKRLHKLLLTSATYRQDSRVAAEAAAIDPENRLLSHMPLRRLEAEALRDALLAVSGTLVDQPYGPAFKPPIAAEGMVARNLKTPYPGNVADDAENHRRSVYMFHKRVIPYPLFQAFDRPDSLQSCGRRLDTTIAPQALALLNDDFVRRRSADFAARLERECGDDDARLVTRAFELAVSRTPSDSERSAALEFLAAQTARRAGDDARSLARTDFCQALFGLNEFLFVD